MRSCRPLCSPDRALDLHCAHALLGFAEQQRSEEPLLQGKMAIIENRAGGNGELVIAALAVEQLLGGFEFDGGHLAARAFNTVRPAQPDKQFAATFVSVNSSISQLGS